MTTRIDYYKSTAGFRQTLVDFCEGKIWQTRCSVELANKLDEVNDRKHANECLKGSIGYEKMYHKVRDELDTQEELIKAEISKLRKDNPKPFSYSEADNKFWEVWKNCDYSDIATQKKAIRAWLYSGGLVVPEDHELINFLWLGCQRGGKADFSAKNLVKSGGRSLTKWTAGKKSIIDFLYAAIAEEMIAVNALRTPFIPESIKERVALIKARKAEKKNENKNKATKVA